jgi:hypothetical protein
MMLYSHDPDQREAGVACIPLAEIKDATALKLARGQRLERYPFRRGSGEITPVAADGEPVITLEVEGRDDYLLAAWPHAVAATVADMLFWLEGIRWRLEPDATAGTARSLVEQKYYPEGYDLPG